MIMWCLEKNLGENNDFEKIATWVKSNIGVVPLHFICNTYWVPIVILIRSMAPCRVPLGNTIWIQRYQAEIRLHPSRDLLKIIVFRPYFF